MLTFVAGVGALCALFALVVNPSVGVMLLFVIRPLVDTAWATPVVGGFKLTELVSTLVPVVVLVRMVFDNGRTRPFRDLPLRSVWLLWSVWVCIFAVEIMFSQGLVDGCDILFRHLNGLAGFYMVQAYCREPQQQRRFFWALVLAGIFPMATGLMEAATGRHWNLTYGEDGVVRNVGLYHDAITIRYYALQTLMGLLLVHITHAGRARALRALLLAYALACLVVVQGAYSKSGVVTVVAWCLMWMLLRRKLKLLLAAAGVVVIAALYYSGAIAKSIGFIFSKELGALQGQNGAQRVFSGRWYIWDQMLDRWHEFSLTQQLFGSGEVALGAHNDYLQILIHGGLVGLSLYLMLLCAVAMAIVRRLRHRSEPFVVVAAMALVMWLVDTIGLVPSAYSGYQWFVWGIIGLCLRQRMAGAIAVTRGSLQSTRRFANLMGAA
jgi:hypothetical protein